MPRKARFALGAIGGLLLATLYCGTAFAIEKANTSHMISLETDRVITLGPTMSPQDTCNLPFPGFVINIVPDWLTGDETYLVYQDPKSSTCDGSVPFGMFGAQFVICFDDACTTQIAIEIYDAVGDTCPVPGDTIFTSGPLTIQAFDGPACPIVGVAFPDTICLYDDFFVALKFLDSVNCFDVVTDTLPGSCISYNDRGDTLIDLNDFDFEGQFYLFAVGLDTASNLCKDPALTIGQVYENVSALDGAEVTVIGDYVSLEEGKLVSSYESYLRRQPMPPNSIVFLDGATPDPEYQYGGAVFVHGTVTYAVNQFPLTASDSVDVTITVDSFTYIYPRSYAQNLSLPSPNESQAPDLGYMEPADCDPCKFAILASGGVNGKENKPAFWEDIEALYKHKTKPADMGGGGYCPENVFVHYFVGESEDPGAIHDSIVQPCTEAQIQATHQEIARRIAECGRNGMKSSVQKMFTNHGVDESGVMMIGNEAIAPEDLKDMQQELIDSCCSEIRDEFTTCFGGDMSDALKELDDMAKTEIHVNSAAGNASAIAPTVEACHYLLEKIAQLEAGKSYEEAVESAKTKYIEFLEAFRDTIISDTLVDFAELDSVTARGIGGVTEWGAPGGPPLIPKEKADSIKAGYREILEEVESAIAEGSVSWDRYQFKQKCEWRRVVGHPGGQLKFHFKGSDGCGNVAIYEEQSDGTLERQQVWMFNLPGGIGYEPGQEDRVIDIPEGSTGIFLVKNDGGEFSFTVDACPNQDMSESVSNPEDFAGFSAGGRDSSDSEFGTIMTPSHFTPGTDGLGFNLENVPKIIGPCGGVTDYTAGFNALATNQWWNQMELSLTVLNVVQPGMLQIQCPTASIPVSQININAPGQYNVPLGSIQAPATGQITFTSQAGLCFTWDCWALQSTGDVWPNYVCGDANTSGSVNIADVTFIIAYIFAGGPAPIPLESGDANCSGGVNIADVTYLIAYIFAGGATPCAEC